MDIRFQYLGFETLLIFYPFIKTPAKSQKWAHSIVIFVTFLYLMILILAFMFFSEGQLPYAIVYLWVACRGMKTAFRIGQPHSLIVFLIAAVTLNYFITDRSTIEWISELYGTVGFYFIYAYIPFMFVCVLIRKRLARH